MYKSCTPNTIAVELMQIERMEGPIRLFFSAEFDFEKLKAINAYDEVKREMNESICL